MPVIECDVTEARSRLEVAGLTIRDGNTDHERWRVTHEGATAVAYDDKVVVQGGQPEALLAHLRDASGRAHVYFDGASRGNPGPSSIGWVIVTDDGIVAEGGELIGTATNNQAEYEALNRALERAAAYGYDVVDVRGDSELIVKQIRGEYGVNDPELRELRVSARETLSRFDDWSIQHVPREVNSRADELANEAFEDD
jgi:ribonuclease HI